MALALRGLETASTGILPNIGNSCSTWIPVAGKKKCKMNMASGCDLLIIDCMEISPKFRGTGVGPIAIDRTIDIFGPVCGLVACKPWPLQFTPAFARDRKALNRLKAPGVGQGEAVRR